MDWEKTYREKGEIQSHISDIVRDSIGNFRKANVKKILDLSFGTGRHTIFLAENGFDVYGIDISVTGKKITEKKVAERGLRNVHLKIADMHSIPFGNCFFDAVVAVNTIEHNTLSGLKTVVSELERVMKPKGILVATLISVNDPRYGTGKEIEPDTFTCIEDPAESGVTHHFSDRKEANDIFNAFELIRIEEKTGYSERRNMMAAHWEILAKKK